MAFGMTMVLAACGGGGDGAPPVTVASVVITAPAAPPTLATLGRTVQFTAQAKDGAGAVVSGATITWSSTATGVASVSGSGLVTAVANGTTQIKATASGISSPNVVVTVSQVLANITVVPNPVTFGAIGSTHQLAATPVDSSGAVALGITLPAFTRTGPGTTATVSASGLVTATGVGATDTAVIGSTKVPITVTQVVKTVTVTSTVAFFDTLFAATRTRQFSAVARDSNNNAIASAVFAWSSNATGIATVSGTGVVTAVADGSATIQAATGGVNGTRAMLIRRLAAAHSITPPNATITTSGGTQGFTAAVTDSAGSAIPVTWVSRFTGVLTVAPLTGTATTATAAGNGSGLVVSSIPIGPVDSATVTVTGQPAAPGAASVTIGDDFFLSVHNGTSNPAVDTVAVGGTVTWTWTGLINHSVLSTGAPSFTGSATKSTGNYPFTFATAGTYTYICGVHGSAMSGTIVVR